MTDADASRGGVGVVVVAAGSGSRLRAEVPKAFVPIGGRPLLAYAISTVAALEGVRSLVVVVPPGYDDTSAWPAGSGAALPTFAVVVEGGAERSDSVRAGLAHVDPSCDVVLVHDAARAFTPVSVFERVVDAVRRGAAGAVPGLPVIDTIKSVDADGVITGTPERDSLRAVQTPQGFDAAVLRAAYDSGATATDDAALVEATGHHVIVVPGDASAFKVTTPEELRRAERLVADLERAPAS